MSITSGRNITASPWEGRCDEGLGQLGMNAYTEMILDIIKKGDVVI